MAKIIIKNCNVAELDIPLKYAQKLYQEYAIRHPNAFFLRTRTRGMQNWDGKIKYVTQRGQFKIGLLSSVIESLKAMGLKDVDIVDLRAPVPKVDKPITSIGKFKLRPEQIAAVESVLNANVNSHPFHIGVLDYTVNAGKSLIMAAIYLSFHKNLKTLLITNDSDWLRQAREEFQEYLPGEPIGFIQGKSTQPWSQFNIGMVQSLSRNIKFYQNEMAKVDMVFVDEADQAGSKQYQQVISHLYNSRVRIGLSGTIYMSKLAKDRVKNMNLKTFFGEILAKFTLRESIKKGYSTNVVVKMIETHNAYKRVYPEGILSNNTYQDIYDKTITQNPLAVEMVLNRVKYNLHLGRTPLLIVCKFIKHAEIIYGKLKETLDRDINIACVHVNTPDKQRANIMKGFRGGKIQILVSTTIIARGKNFPLLKCMINAGSMKAQEKSIQFLGRLVRTHESKSKAYFDDIHYPGRYLDNHGKSRRRYYQEQGLKVIRKKV